MKEKIIIYQVVPRIFGNENTTNKYNGTITENGSGKMSAFTDKALKSIRSLGANHIWYTGLLQHASKTSYPEYDIPKQNHYVVKGEAGSPYAITDYYSISPDLADDPSKRIQEFEELVKRTHKNKLKLIIDFVPNHVARQYKSLMKPLGVKDFGEDDNTEHAFDNQNNFYYMPGQGFAPGIDLGKGDKQYVEYPAKATGNDCFHPYPGVNDWYETVKLNYGVDYSNGNRVFNPVPDTWHKMLDILVYWAGKGVDGFRCDMAHMVPIEFWEWCIRQVKDRFPGIIFIAEIYNPDIYREYLFRGGFDYLYDKVGLYDTLRAIVEGKAGASAITHCWQSLEGIQSHMLNFLENHDEQRIASEFFAGDPLKAIPALITSALMNTNPFMVYFGEELGEPGMNEEGFSGRDGRTSIFDYCSLDTIIKWNNGGKWTEQGLTPEQKKVRKLYRQVLNLCNDSKAIAEGEFYDVMYVNYNNPGFDTDKQYAFLRKKDEQLMLIVVNFAPVKSTISVKLPQHMFDFWGIDKKHYSANEFFSGKTANLNLSPEVPFETLLEGYSGVIYEFDLKESKSV